MALLLETDEFLFWCCIQCIKTCTRKVSMKRMYYFHFILFLNPATATGTPARGPHSHIISAIFSVLILYAALWGAVASMLHTSS